MLPIQLPRDPRRQCSENKEFFGKIDHRHFQINLINKIYTEISHKKLTYTSKVVQLAVSPTPPSGQKERTRKISCNVKWICFAWKEYNYKLVYQNPDL